jgi:multidrug efflux system membrane fusion protein
MRKLSTRLSRRLAGASLLTVIAIAAGVFVMLPSQGGHATDPAKQAPPATPVSVAAVEQRKVTVWDEFSGRLEAVERVEVRPRVAGSIQKVHFREGALVSSGDLLITIDPAPYAAEVDRLEAQVGAAQARVELAQKELERSQQLKKSGSSAISESNADQRASTFNEAEANLRSAKAALQSARLNLGYTEVRAPVSGRVGKLEITVGNLVSAGAGAPLLTTLVSVSPIYASFNADEAVVLRAMKSLGSAGINDIARIPVEILTATSNGEPYRGRLQLIDNQIDIKSGTVRARAIFDNADGRLMPGQFVRIRMGQAEPQSVLLISERAIGTDQGKKFVMVVNGESKVEYREITLGVVVDGRRVVTNGLNAGERIVVNGLQRVRPGAQVAPQLVAMDGKELASTTSSPASTDTAQR